MNLIMNLTINLLKIKTRPYFILGFNNVWLCFSMTMHDNMHYQTFVSINLIIYICF